MAKPWEQDWSVDGGASAGSNAKPWEQDLTADPAAAKPKSRTAADVAKDIGITALKGAINVPAAVVGLADIPTGGRVGKFLEDTVGFRPGDAKQILDDGYSEAQKAANAEVRQADGFIDTARAALENPSTIALAVGESLPSMFAGGLIGRGLMAIAPKVAPWVAGGIGEGVVGAGSAASEIRDQTEDGLLTGKQAAAAAASGVGTAVLGAAGGKLAQRMGVPDVDTMIASGKLASTPAGFAKAVLGAGITEGAFEEMPQSAQEQMLQNYALGKPLTDGVGNAMAMGLVTGAAMGGAGGGFNVAASSFGKQDDVEDQSNGTPAGAPAGQAPAAQAPAAAGGDGAAAPAPGVSAARGSAAPAQATGVATGDTEAAEQALRTPVSLTALDRANEIDTETARITARLAELSPENGYGPVFDAERTELAQQASQLQAERERIAATWPSKIDGAPTQFSTEAGVKLDGQYAVMDAADLVTSHDENLRANPLYPKELQPRDRSRSASEIQVSGIVQKLDPARLGLSADAATGAPIVGADGLVESGNARTIALKRVYQANGQKAADYKAWLQQNAQQFGLTPEMVSGMAKPVLVRVRSTPVNRAEFARQANASTVQRMSPAEQAAADAKRLASLEGLEPDEMGDFASSHDFIRQFMATLPVTEQSDMIESDGRLSTAGYRRIQNAVLAKAYGDSPTLRRMTESLDNNLANVSKALVRVAPTIAAARERMQAGSLYEADIAPDLVQAVEGLSALKDKGWTVEQELGQVDLTGPKYSPEATELLRFLADNARSPRRIAEFMQRYYQALEAAGDPNQGSLLGDTGPAPTRTELLQQAKGPTDATDPQPAAATEQPAAGPGAAPAPAAVGGQEPGGTPGRGDGAQGDAAGTEGVTDELQAQRAEAVREFKDALADLAEIASKHTRASMVPENTPDLMPTLTRLFGSAIKLVGTDMKRATAWVKDQLKKDPRFKTFWNKIAPATYNKAALAALDARPQDAQASLFDDQAQAEEALQGDLFAAAPPAAPAAAKPAPQPAPKAAGRTVVIDGIEHDLDAQNFGLKPWPKTLKDGDPLLVETNTKPLDSLVTFNDFQMTRAEMHRIIIEWHFERAQPAPADRKPIAYVMGGGGASGKGTIKKLLRAQGLISDDGAVNLDPDEIKLEIPEYQQIVQAGDSRAAAIVHEESSSLSKQIKKRAMDGRYDLVLDVTLGDLSKGEKYLSDLKAAGYEVRLFGVTTDPATSVIRADARARKSGRYVPVRDLLHAHKGFNAAFEAYAKIADSAMLYENTDGRQKLAEATAGQQLQTVNGYNVVAERSQINEQATTLGEIGGGEPGMGRADRQVGGREPGAGRPSANGSAGGRGDAGQGRGPVRADQGATESTASGGVNADDRPGEGNAQGQGTDTAQGSGQQGRTDGVRARRGRGNQQPDRDGDAGATAARAVGQAGPDGKRGADARGRSDEPGAGTGRVGGIPAGRDIAVKTGRNYAFGPDDLTYEGSWVKKAEQNIAAVELIKVLQKEGRQANREEQAVLAKFIGWGASDLANNLFGKKLDAAAEALKNYEQAVESLDRLGRPLRRGMSYSGTDAGFYQAFQVLTAAGDKRNYYQVNEISRADLDKARPDASTRKWLELRDRLKRALTPDEYADAARSTQYAHYTSKAVVSAMWKATQRMGFAGGTILEPGAGIGVFPGLMPAEIANNSSYTGIEFDPMTGAILQQLFPDERNLVESFVDTKLPKNFFDVAIGNPPFSRTPILADPEYAKMALSLHDYFFAKTMDRVKPGGLVMFVTSRYTMDKLDDKARQYLIERADLVGAIRLPQTAFKQNAGTEVVTDVLFLRKKVPGETFEHAKPWAKVVEVKGPDGKTLMVSGGKDKPDRPALINEYFADNPGMVLGQHANTGSMYAEKEYTVTPLDGDIEAHFLKAVEQLPAGIYTAERGSAAEAAKVREIDFNPKAQKEGNYYVTDAGVLMVRESGVGQRVELRNQKDVELIKDFVPLRDALKQAHYDQLNDGDWETSLRSLQTAYKAFTKKHGQVNQFVLKTVKTKAVDEETGQSYTDEAQVRSFPLLQKLRDDPDYTLVAALETINDDTGEIKPSNFLTERVLGKPEQAAVNSPSDALLTVLNDVGHVDIGLIASRVGMSEQDAIEALGSAIYEDPATGWQTADEYLSGNVKRKLDEARAAAQADRRFERNVTALEGAQPAPKVPSQIDPSIGMNWIPGDVYAQFLKETTGVTARIEWNARTKQWIIEEKAGGKTMQATSEWGTDKRNATDLMEAALTGRQIRITEGVGTGSDRKIVFDAAGTELANQKLDALRTAFSTWIWQDADRTDRLVKIYNDTFNTTVPRSFDGRHLTLPGTSKAFHVFDHVKRGAWRIIQRGNTYLAHAVGSGKTFQMVIAAMEQKRLGLIKKPMVVVPNHMLKQFAHEWQLLYPAARLMVADENNFHTENRRRFVSRVALSDLDGVIITHSAFKLLDLDPEFKAKMIKEQLEYMEAALEEAKDADDTGRSPKVKQIQKQVENLEQKLQAALSSEGKDKNVRFDELGVDFLMVDEAHEYRKLEFGTSRQVKGISSEGSQKAFDLYMKSRYLEEKNPGRSLVMASGTVITNTLAELYTVQKFMDRQALVDKGIEDFDSWAAMFGRERTALEPDASGKYAPVTRFSKFVNVPELTQMFREFADVLTSDHLAALLGDKRPKVEGGSREIIVTPKTEAYAEYQSELEMRVRESKAWKPSKDEPNNPDPMIRIIGDGRLAAIDMRFVNPAAPNDPDSKLNTMITDVIAKFKETADMEYRDKAGNLEPNKGATMMVFSDLGFGEGVAKTRGFNARAWFEKRLRDEGIPMAQVAFMSDYKNSADKLKLFKDVNAGRVRVLVGSSKNMGTGVNAQQRLKALFHLDSPWYPADLEQREGRIVRQGNKNPLVQIYAYAAKGTYDETMWKMLASKQYFIDQAMSGDENLREIEDLDSQSQFDLAAAMVAEDPRILQLAGLRAEVEKLQRLFKAHEDQRQRFRQQYDVASTTVEFNEKRLPDAEKSAAMAQDLSGDKFVAKVMGKPYTERADWAKALVARFNALVAEVNPQTQTIGEISGFKVAYKPEAVAGQYYGSLVVETPQGALLHQSFNSEPNMAGLAMRAQNAVAEVARLPFKMRERITEARAQMDALRERLAAPFAMAGMLADKVKEANDLEAIITAEGKAKEAAAQQAKEAAQMTGQDDGETRLSRGAATGDARVSVQSLQDLAARIKRSMPNMPKVNVLADPSEAPKALRQYILQQGAWADVEGAMHNGEFFLFASGLADEARAEHVLAEHEAAHFGLRAVLGGSLKTALNLIYLENAAVRKAATALQARGKLSNTEATEEVIVDIPTTELARLKGWRKVVRVVADALAKRGFQALAQRLDDWLAGTLTQQQRADLVVAELVSAARDYMKGKRAGRRSRATGTRLSGTLAEDIERQEKWLQAEARARGFKDIEDLLEKDYPTFEKLATLWREKNPADSLLSRGQDQTQTEAFKRWFAGSKVVDAEGKPLVVYHGTAADFAEFSNAKTGANDRGMWGRGHYFAASAETANSYAMRQEDGASLIPAYVSIRNPLVLQTGQDLVTRLPDGTDVKSLLGPNLDGAKIKEMALAAGHDGVIQRRPNGLIGDVVAYRPEQIKSAIGNRGTFDTNNADIRMSRAPGKTTAADRAEAIIQKKAAGFAPLDAIAKAATTITGAERLTGAIYDRAGALLARMTPEKVKAGIVSDYGVPEAVIDQRIMLQGRQRVQLRKAGQLIEKLATLTREESRVAYEWMNMDGSDPKAYLSKMQGLPEESVLVLQDVQKLIDDLSQEAVRLGQLEPEAFKRNRFAYLRRSYAKHILEQTAGEKAKRSRVISILGDQYKGRGLTQLAAMDKIKAGASDWWARKLKPGQADTALKGEKLLRLERLAPTGAGTRALPGMTGRGDGKVLEVAYWPADEALPAKYADWRRADTWEVRDVKGGNAILWRDFTKAEREQMGEIDEARFAIAKTLHGMIHDVEVGRYLEWLGKNYAKSEGQPVPGVVVEASERMRDTFAPSEWVKVPDTKIPGTSVLKYGKLAGKYLPGPIWNDLRQVVAGGRFRPFGDTYAAILSAWKTSKTALSPAVHMNNVMSNFVMADWQDVRAAHVGKALRIILAASGRQGGITDAEAATEILNRYKDSGGDVGSWVTQEISRDQMEPLLAGLEQELAATDGQSLNAQAGTFAALQHVLYARFPEAWEAFKAGKPGKVTVGAAGKLIDLYQAEDDVFRLAAWLKSKEEGADDLTAGKSARRSFLDYNINAPWIQAMRQSAWPFISFTYRAVPLLAEIAGKKPHKLFKLMMLAGGLNALGVLMGGGGDDDERKLLPDEKAGKVWGMVPKLIRMPWNDDHGSPVYLDIRRWVPVGDVFDIGQGHAAIPMLPGLMPGGPLVIAGEVVLNRSAFTGKPISLETDTPVQKATKLADYLYKAFAPNILGLPNTYATEGVVGSMTGRTDAFGREFSTAQAVASSFGVKLGSYPTDVLRRNQAAATMAKTSEIDKQIAQLKRQLQTGRLTREEFDEAVAVEIEKKRKVVGEFREKLQ